MSRVLIFACVLCGICRTSLATPASDFAAAKDAFRRGDYKDTVEKLNLLLYPSPKLGKRSDLAEAHMLLGVAHLELGSETDAEREFSEVVELDEHWTMPSFFPRAAIDLFDRVRAVSKKQRESDSERRALMKENERLRNMVIVEKRPYYVNFVPFGAGQLQNGHDSKAIFFFTSQGLTAGASAVIFMYQVLKYDLRGSVPREDAVLVRRLQQVQIASGVAFFGLYAWSVIDSLIHYEPTARRSWDDTDIPRLPPASPKQTSRRRIIIAPSPLPDGAGVVAHWEF